MNILIFDTETSGFHSKTLAADHPDQGHMMQLACSLINEKGQVFTDFVTLVEPEVTYLVNAGAFAQHHIEYADCVERGMKLDVVLDVFDQLYQVADLVVAHNLAFDSKILNNARALAGRPELAWNTPKHFCTMEAMTPICRLPAKFKGTEFKWPKLEEAHEYCFKTKHEKAHDAMGDVKATTKVWLWLQEKKQQTVTV